MCNRKTVFVTDCSRGLEFGLQYTKRIEYLFRRGAIETFPSQCHDEPVLYFVNPKSGDDEPIVDRRGDCRSGE